MKKQWFISKNVPRCARLFQILGNDTARELARFRDFSRVGKLFRKKKKHSRKNNAQDFEFLVFVKEHEPFRTGKQALQ